MLTQEDLRGVCVMMVTPSKEGADKISFRGNTVDLDEAARVAEAMIQAGIGSFALCGTTGEGHSLTFEEKVTFIDTVSQVNRDRIPIFAGSTTLGTRETVKHMKALKDLGAPGAFVGLPLWQSPTIENSSQFYTDLGEAMPDMAIMIYANQNFFKTDFPVEFWEALVAKKPQTVLVSKMSNTEANMKAAGKQVYFMPGTNPLTSYLKLQELGLPWRNFWSTRGNCGPEPLVALGEALDRGDVARAEEIEADTRAVPGWQPPQGTSQFTSKEMNVQGERMMALYGGYMKPGPLRPPYTDVAPEYLAAGKAAGTAWAKMREKYVKQPAQV